MVVSSTTPFDSATGLTTVDNFIIIFSEMMDNTTFTTLTRDTASMGGFVRELVRQVLSIIQTTSTPVWKVLILHLHFPILTRQSRLWVLFCQVVVAVQPTINYVLLQEQQILQVTQ